MSALRDFIPPSFVTPECVFPLPIGAFLRRPAKQIRQRSLIRLHGCLYRVVGIRPEKKSLRTWYELYPVAGGYPTSEPMLPDQAVEQFVMYGRR